jgi:hypothetical protein
MTGNPGSASGTGRQTPTAGTEHHPSGALLVGTATLRGDRFSVRQLVLADPYLSLETVGVAEEDAVYRAEVVDGAVAGAVVDQPLPDGGERLR